MHSSCFFLFCSHEADTQRAKIEFRVHAERALDSLTRAANYTRRKNVKKRQAREAARAGARPGYVHVAATSAAKDARRLFAGAGGGVP